MPRNDCDSSLMEGATACNNNNNNNNNNDGGGVGGNVRHDDCAYPDDVIMDKGVAFNVRYTGCIEVKTSMKSLDFSTRTQVARECINRVCEAAGLKSITKRRLDKKILQFISDRPCMQNAGTNVMINVSSRALSLINEETGEMIATHNMPHISFASGGDSDTLDFLGYIAKNKDEWRACYVLECIDGQSEDLILTIGKAFMLRYNALHKKSHEASSSLRENDKDYYNDLPNKLPPDLLAESGNLVNPQIHQILLQTNNNDDKKLDQSLLHKIRSKGGDVSKLNLQWTQDRLSSNLIDLNSPSPDQTSSKMNLSNFNALKDALNTAPTTTTRDVFDIQPFSLSAEVQRSQLITESWFHAAISRPIAEALLKNDGDFLVRESQGKHGQYVLTGLEGTMPKHLLLIDPEGVVRTKDRIFDSISHLINYHWNNALPIISEDSELLLRTPIPRQIANT